MADDEAPMPGAFPSAPVEVESESPTATRVPKRRFVGRRTAEAQARQKQQDTNSNVEETTAVIQNGKVYTSKHFEKTTDR